MSLLAGVSRTLTEYEEWPATFLKLLASFSDQQIITGIAIQIVGLAQIEALVTYHFFIVWTVASLSTTTHMITLVALKREWRKDPFIRGMRIALMAISLALVVTYGIINIVSLAKGLRRTLPVACLFVNTPNSSDRFTNKALTTLPSLSVLIGITCSAPVLFALAVAILGPEWFWLSRKAKLSEFHFEKASKWVALFLQVVLAVVVGFQCFIVITSSAAFGGKIDYLANESNEVTWSFGQVLPIILLLLPILSAIEVFRGSSPYAPPVKSETNTFTS